MNRGELVKLAEETFETCKSLLAGKGAEYSKDNNVFSVFEKCGDDLDVSPLIPIKLFMDKHYSSITSYVKKVVNGADIDKLNSELSEPIDGRIQDMINYLIILEAYIKSQSSKVNSEVNSSTFYKKDFEDIK
jgi:hypothetical protein